MKKGLKSSKMIQEGKINAAEGLELLKALDEADMSETENIATIRGQVKRFLKVRVYTEEGNKKVNINLPLNFLSVASKFVNFGTKFIPESAQEEIRRKGIDLNQFDFEQLIEQINQGLAVDGKIVDIEANDPKEGRVRVEIYVE